MTMEEGTWESLLELTLYPCNHGESVYCLCSRAFLTNKTPGYLNDDLDLDLDGKHGVTPDGEHLQLDISHDLHTAPAVQIAKKLELEAASCYCSASHYSTDDYESVIMSTTDAPSKSKKVRTPCPLQNSDSGADLSEHFPDGARQGSTEHSDNQQSKVVKTVQTPTEIKRPKLNVDWERFWAENGEAIIWQSWIEKYGAYVNPNYGDVMMTVEPEKAKAEIPDVKVVNVDEGDEERILKSNSFGSASGYERLRHGVRSRCSNTSLSGKSIANTAVTTDSLTNVTKITLSSLDLSCECESEHGGSMISSSSSSATEPSSSSESGQDDSGRDNDTWWRRVWKEHYEFLYGQSYQNFYETYVTEEVQDKLPSSGDEKRALEAAKAQLIKKFCCEPYEKADSENDLLQRLGDRSGTEVDSDEGRAKLLDKFGAKERRENSFRSWSYVNSVGYIIQKLNEASICLDAGLQDTGEVVDSEEITKDDAKQPTSQSSEQPTYTGTKRTSVFGSNKRSFEDADEEDGEDKKPRKQPTRTSSHETESSSTSSNKQSRKLERVKAAMTLMSIPYVSNPDEGGFRSGHVTYQKRNIRSQNRRLKLSMRTHLWFDDEGAEDRKETTVIEVPPLDPAVYEPEALGYEAHSSSLDNDSEAQDLGGDAISGGKKQRKKKRKQRKPNANLPPEILEDKGLLKYWRQRYRLFLKYDEGIRLDRESWFSVTPEKVAVHHAERCRCDLLIDGFCGAGGNSIQFSYTCERVLAIDKDPEKIALARHNAAIYGVADRIEFIVGDFMLLAPTLKGDVVFLSPPWGGPDYLQQDVYPLSALLEPHGGQKLYEISKAIAPDLAIFLPRNVNSYDIQMLPGEGGAVEIEQNFLDSKLIGVTAYFGDLIHDSENIETEAGSW